MEFIHLLQYVWYRLVIRSDKIRCIWITYLFYYVVTSQKSICYWSLWETRQKLGLYYSWTACISYFLKISKIFKKKKRQKKKCLHFLEIETRRPSIQKLYIKKLKTLFWLLYYSLIIFNYQIALVRTSPWIWHRSLLLPFQSYYALLSIVHPILQHMVSIINYINT